MGNILILLFIGFNMTVLAVLLAVILAVSIGATKWR